MSVSPTACEIYLMACPRTSGYGQYSMQALIHNLVIALKVTTLLPFYKNQQQHTNNKKKKETLESIHSAFIH